MTILEPPECVEVRFQKLRSNSTLNTEPRKTEPKIIILDVPKEYNCQKKRLLLDSGHTKLLNLLPMKKESVFFTRINLSQGTEP